MKESQEIRLILYCFRAFGLYPFDIQTDLSRSLHLKLNTSWYVYAMVVTLVHFINVIEVTVKPNWDITNFHGLVAYTRLILVSFDALICCLETLYNLRLHVDFFETIAELGVTLKKFEIKVACKRLRFWVSGSVLMLATLNVIPQAFYIYDICFTNPKPITASRITLQFEIPNFLASIKSLQIIFYAFLILEHLNALEKVQESYESVAGNNLTFDEFNHFHNHLCNLIDLFNKCFGWSIMVNVTRDFIFFGEGTYLMLFKLKSKTQIKLLMLIWSHIFYCVFLCVMCQRIHGKAVQLRTTGLLIQRTKFEVNRMRTVPNSEFSLKALHNVTIFNALGCFVIDLKLLYSFFVFLTNYLLICVQFTMAGEGEHF